MAEEQEQPERFDWDDAAILTEDFKIQLAERGFPDVEVFWSLGYCQGDGVAFYGSVYPEDLKEKDPQAKEFIEALERAGDVLSIWITGKNNHYHHWNSMTVEVEFEEEDETFFFVNFYLQALFFVIRTLCGERKNGEQIARCKKQCNG